MTALYLEKANTHSDRAKAVSWLLTGSSLGTLSTNLKTFHIYFSKIKNNIVLETNPGNPKSFPIVVYLVIFFKLLLHKDRKIL